MFAQLSAYINAAVNWIKPYKELTGIILLLSGTISGGVAYATSYFATRAHLEAVECILNGKFELLPFELSVEENEIESRTRLAGHFALLPPTLDVRAFSAQMQKDIDQLRDRRIARQKELMDRHKTLIRKCNPGARVP